MRTWLGWVIALVSLSACQSGAAIGTVCTRSADCASPLVCGLGRCRAQCVEARDCGPGQVCLAPSAGAGVCEIPAVDVCALSCDAPLVCVGGHCRQACSAGTDCPAGHACAVGGCERSDVAGDAGVGDGAADLDGAASDAGWACDPVANTGCNGSRRCGIVGGAPVCVSQGAGAEDSVCATETDCGAGLTCQNARCHRLCYDADSTACGQDRYCGTTVISNADALASGLAYCSERCDPLATTNAACGPATHCVVDTDVGNRPYTFCVAGVGSSGAACGGQAFCGDGLACDPDLHVCSAFCDSTTAGQCVVGVCHIAWTFVTGPIIGLCR